MEMDDAWVISILFGFCFCTRKCEAGCVRVRAGIYFVMDLFSAFLALVEA